MKTDEMKHIFSLLFEAKIDLSWNRLS